MSLYVHLPFCVRKCRYCDFNSHAFVDHDLDAHVDAVVAEATMRAEGLRPQTVFVGGGTPTLIGPARMTRLLDGLDRATGFRASASEVTMEANPESLDAATAEAMRGGGVDRVSIGVQSLDDEVLRAYDRVHDGDTALAAFDVACAAGFKRINLDLIYAFPGQDTQAWEDTLATVHALGPEHLSCYELSYEPGTTLTKLRDKGKWHGEDPERCAALFERTRELNAAAGYAPYEVSAFARAGEACRHNLAYWRSLDYVGIGAGAAGWRDGERRQNLAAPEEYRAAVEAGRDPHATRERPTPAMRLFDHLMMGLRLEHEGVSLARAEAQCGDAVGELRPKLDELVDRGLLAWVEREQDTRLVATAGGYRILDSVLAELLPDGDGMEV